MDQLVRELFRSNMAAFDASFSAKTDTGEYFSRLEDLTEKIKQKVPVEYHALLQEYERSMLMLMDAACEDEYVRGYRLGVGMLLAAWPAFPRGISCEREAGITGNHIL